VEAIFVDRNDDSTKPVATIEDPLKPLIGRGDVGVSPEESLLSNSVAKPFFRS
jgi:hypothetical protein